MDHILRVDKQLQLFGGDIRLDDGSQIMNHIRKVHICLFNRNLAAFDAAHIQHIIDQGQKVLARHGDFPQIILHLLLIVNVRSSQRCKSDDSVHGSSDIM